MYKWNIIKQNFTIGFIAVIIWVMYKMIQFVVNL